MSLPCMLLSWGASGLQVGMAPLVIPERQRSLTPFRGAL